MTAQLRVTRTYQKYQKTMERTLTSSSSVLRLLVVLLSIWRTRTGFPKLYEKEDKKKPTNSNQIKNKETIRIMILLWKHFVEMFHDELEGNSSSTRITCHCAHHSSSILFANSRFWIEYKRQITNKNPRIPTATQSRQYNVTIMSRCHVETHSPSKLPFQLPTVFYGRTVSRRAKIGDNSN